MKYDEKIASMITSVLDKCDLEYHMSSFEEGQVITHDICLYGIKLVTCRFFINNEDKDVSMRAFSIAPCYPDAERSRMLEACNILNKHCAHLKFVLDEDDFDAYYDFPVFMSDDCTGETVVEMINRTVNLLLILILTIISLKGIKKVHYIKPF